MQYDKYHYPACTGAWKVNDEYIRRGYIIFFIGEYFAINKAHVLVVWIYFMEKFRRKCNFTINPDFCVK